MNFKGLRLNRRKASDKPVQTSEFAYSEALDRVKEKEVLPDKPKK